MSDPTTTMTPPGATGQDQQSGLTRAAGEHAQQVAGQAKSQVDERSTQAGQKVTEHASSLRSVAEHLRSEGKESEARYAEQAAEKVERAGSDADKILHEIEDFGRQRPWAVIGAGIAIGIAAGRVLKADHAPDRLRHVGRAGERDDVLMSVHPGHGEDLRDRSIGELLKQLSQETPTLGRQELDPAKAEMAEKGKHAGKGIGLFSGAGLFGLGAFLALTAAIVAALALRGVDRGPDRGRPLRHRRRRPGQVRPVEDQGRLSRRRTSNGPRPGHDPTRDRGHPRAHGRHRRRARLQGRRPVSDQGGRQRQGQRRQGGDHRQGLGHQ